MNGARAGQRHDRRARAPDAWLACVWCVLGLRVARARVVSPRATRPALFALCCIVRVVLYCSGNREV